MKKFICETKNLSKKYKDFYALKNVNLTIPKGEIYGLVGENGAGKTTLIRLLTGLNFKSEGEIILFGHTDNLQYERAKIGCTIEMPALYKDMTASQNLEVQRIQRGIPNKKCIADTLVDRFIQCWQKKSGKLFFRNETKACFRCCIIR